MWEMKEIKVVGSTLTPRSRRWAEPDPNIRNTHPSCLKKEIQMFFSFSSFQTAVKLLAYESVVCTKRPQKQLSGASFGPRCFERLGERL